MKLLSKNELTGETSIQAHCKHDLVHSAQHGTACFSRMEVKKSDQQDLIEEMSPHGERDQAPRVDGGNGMRREHCERRRLGNEQWQHGHEDRLCHRCFPGRHEDAVTVTAMVARAIRVRVLRCLIFWCLIARLGRLVVVTIVIVVVSVVVTMFATVCVCRTDHFLSTMRVVRTAAQREVQHKGCGGDEGDERSHCSPARESP